MRNLSCKSRWAVTAPVVMAVFFLSSHSLWAQEDLERPPPIPPEDLQDVPIPPKIQDEQIEPTVNIRQEEGRMIEEYRLNGQVYMVKVTPEGGVPYYYVDNDGDGRLELDMSRGVPDPVQPVYWKVKEWK